LAKFETSHAVTLFTQQTTIINGLWTVYVVATFAAAGYGLSSNGLSPVAALAVTFGFLAFAGGNLSLICQALRINVELGNNLKADLGKPDPGALDNSNTTYDSAICCLAETANPPCISVAIHVFIDVCVIVALWSHVK
jgi:hypothetical protein